MSETFRRTKLERFVRRLEAKLSAHHGNSSEAKVLREVIAEIKQEFKLEVKK